MTSQNVNWMGIVGLIGSILMIVGVFLTWAEMGVSVLGVGTSIGLSGLDVFSGSVDINVPDWTIPVDNILLEYAYAPVVCLVVGIVGLIASIVAMFYNGKPAVGRGLGAVSLILAIVAIIIAVLYNGQMVHFGLEDIISDSPLVDILDLDVWMSSGSGFWVSVVGGVILAIGGIFDIVKRPAVRDEPAEPKDETPSE